MTRHDTPSSHGDRDRAPRNRAHHTAAPRTAKHPPQLTIMTPEACQALLMRHHVGRMAFCFREHVDITPLHYVYSDGWLFARTAHGAKMEVLAHAPWVAFEVDEMDSVFDWRSVVAHGTAHLMPREGNALDRDHWARGIELLREVVPETGTADDPVPFRTVVFGIWVHSMTGRAASTRT